MTMYVTIPHVDTAAGTDWETSDWQQYIVDNMNFLNSLLSGMIPGSTFALNEVLIGGAGGSIVGVDHARRVVAPWQGWSRG